MRYAAVAVTTVLVMPFLGACGQAGSPASPQTVSGAPFAAASDAADATAEALGQKGTLTFKGRLDGQLTQDQPIAGTTELSRVTEASGHAGRFGKVTVTILHLRNGATATEAGSYEFTSSKGGTLQASFTGSGTFIVDGEITVNDMLTITGGTGVFAGATGTISVTRVYTNATGDVSATFTGDVTFLP